MTMSIAPSARPFSDLLLLAFFDLKRLTRLDAERVVRHPLA